MTLKLLDWNQAGLVPGPEESEEDYRKRAEYCLQLKTKLEDELAPFGSEAPANNNTLKGAFQKTEQLFDIVPEWIPLYFSNYRLTPWHGGCVWIFQIAKDTPTAAFLQLRNAFSTSSSYFNMYDRDELAAHELAHVGRMTFQEPKFEEVLAYRTSPSQFRRWFGPIVKSSWESLLFVLTLFMVFLIDLSYVYTGEYSTYRSAMWFKALPLGLLALALGRLWWRQWQFSRCFQKLRGLLPDEKTANAVIYRLTDQEIIAFSKMVPVAIQQFVDDHKEESLRWNLIANAYFSSKGN
ncbi:MAG: hypothetical protein K940chlam7_00114 [Chlamydiae bacterium]|nr:hypothetical protein [Chlamydiota bacterium]